MRTVLIIGVLILQVFASEKHQFYGYKVIRIVPKDVESIELLINLEKSVHYNFWSEIKNVNHSVDVMVPPYKIQELEDLLRQSNVDYSVFISNVQELIDNQKAETRDKNFGWKDYYTLDEINLWLESLVQEYPDNVKIENAGKTYQGRDILGVYVSFSSKNAKKAVFIEANIHACEWIGSSVATYILNELLTSTDPRVRQVAESHDWYVFPVINPDGFDYTHTTNRTWRKTRHPHDGTKCIGADPNRNWDYHFNEGGASSDPCSEMYGGPNAFSETTVQSLADYFLTIGDQLEGYISFHSYSQMLLLPYGYTPDHLDNYDDLYSVGLKAINALQKHRGTQYEVGNVAELMYIASGGSPDWIKGIFGTKITYTFELPDKGKYGFLLPADLIIPTAEETFDAFLTIFEEFAKL